MLVSLCYLLLCCGLLYFQADQSTTAEIQTLCQMQRVLWANFHAMVHGSDLSVAVVDHSGDVPTIKYHQTNRRC